MADEESGYKDFVAARLKTSDRKKAKRLKASRVTGCAILAISFLMAFALVLLIDNVAPVRHFDTFCLFFFWIAFAIGGFKISDRVLVMIFGRIILQDKKDRGQIYKDWTKTPEGIKESAQLRQRIWEWQDLRFRMIFMMAVLMGPVIYIVGRIGAFYSIVVPITVSLAWIFALISYRKEFKFFNKKMSFYVSASFLMMFPFIIFLAIAQNFMPEDVALGVAFIPALFIAIFCSLRIGNAMTQQETEEYRTRFRHRAKKMQE